MLKKQMQHKDRLIQYLGCFSVAVAATTNERELQCRCKVGNSITMSAAAQMQHQSCAVVGGQWQAVTVARHQQHDRG